MIGCGGAGNKVVRFTRDAVERQLKRTGWDRGVPHAWQFIGIDSNVFQEDSMVPLLPNNDFIHIARRFHTYQQLHDELMVRFGPKGIQPDVFDELMGWRPNPHQVTFPPFINGLGQSRAIGRTAGIVDLQGHLSDRIRFAFGSCDAGGPELHEVSRHLGIDVPPGQPVPNPIVLIVGSMAGGTGAGIMLDVVDLVRAIHVDGAFPTLVALTPDVFGSVQNDAMTANSVAFMSELLNAYWDREAPEAGIIPPNVQVHTRGPHSVYVIGRRNLDGLDLSDSRNVYRAIGDVLAAVTTSVRVQQDFHHFKTVDWANKAAANAGGYGFADEHLPGVVSSFGTATISVGRDRFRTYMQKLLLRSIVEQLTHGYEEAAINAFGLTEAKTISASKKIEDLAHRNLGKFLFDCGLEVEQLGEFFYSNEEMRSQHSEISQVLKGSLPLSKAQSFKDWQQLIFPQAQIIRSWNRETKSSLSDESIKLWISDVYRRVLHACNEFSAKLSLPVVLLILELVRTDVMKSASVLRERAQLSRSNMANAEVKSRVQLNGSKGRVAASSSLIQEAVSEIAKSIVWEWSADLQEKLAVVLESVATSMLTSIEAGLRQSNSRLDAMVASQDGRPPISTGWPRNDGVVPVSFTPSPVEFFLEDYTAWPQHARELIQQSLGDRLGMPIDPIEAARNLIIRGGFGKSSNEVSVNPLIWDEGNKSDPAWTSDRPSFIRVDDSIEGLGERIDAWLSRPATVVNRVLTEGLAAYLSPEDPITCAPVADHLQRLKLFKEKLQLALMQSRPLIEIDESLNAVVHPRPISCSLNIGGFPFGEGHPARELTENVLQSFLGTAQPLDWAFASAETELVSLTSFLEHPVNPSVIASFTEPLAGSINRMNPNLLSYSFWQWRRARTLQKFIPLPYELRLAAIRGFAIARAIGVMSAEVQRQNVIADRDGDKFFPKHLLTLTDRNNLLPALLEAMVLTFAEVSTKGKDAFAAYESLINYGTGEYLDEIQVGGLVKHFIDTGDYDGVRIVDQDRANSVVGIDRYQRAEKIIEYLQRNIERFEDLERSGPDPQSWRNQIGDVNPIDTLSHELLTDLRNAYGQVLDAVRKWQNPPQYLV
jgi:hypothetical protein